jgi:hypothetical protein
MGREFDERIDMAIAQAGNEIDRLSYRAAKASRELRLREATELTRAYLDQRPGDATSYGLLLRLANQLGERQLAAAALDALWPRTLTSVELAVLHMSSPRRHRFSSTPNSIRPHFRRCCSCSSARRRSGHRRSQSRTRVRRPSSPSSGKLSQKPRRRRDQAYRR